MVLAEPGDVLLFRSDCWHSAIVNLSANQARLVVETNFGAHKVAGGSYGGGGAHRHLELAPETAAAATREQLRRLGKDVRSMPN